MTWSRVGSMVGAATLAAVLFGGAAPAQATDVAVVNGGGGGADTEVTDVVAFESNRSGSNQIWTMAPDGTELTQITADEDFLVALYPEISPDGRSIVFQGGAVGDSGSHREIFVAPTEGGDATQLTNNEFLEWAPTWSPDGSKIAFSRMVNGVTDLYVMDADGSDLEQVTDDAASNTAANWSPDGTRLAYEVANQHVRVLELASGQVTDITTGTLLAAGGPEWSPDGARIAVHAVVDGSYQIVLVDPDGGNPEQITFASFSHTFPTWSPDGTGVAFGGFVGDNFEILTVGVDGSNETQVTNAPGRDANPSWGACCSPTPSGLGGLLSRLLDGLLGGLLGG